jgi:DNA-binding GntR family transcriptional regulator
VNKAIIKADLLHYQVADRLRDMVVAGDLIPGDSISERELCELFGISRTPLREALKVLVSEDLVRLLPRRGAMVAHISPEMLIEKFQAAKVLEAYAAEFACANSDPQDVEALEELMQKIEASVAKEQVGRYFEATGRFHRNLVEMTGNKTLIKVYSEVMAHLTRARVIGLRSEPNQIEAAKFHRDLLRAIKRQDAAAAKRLMIEFMDRVQRKVLIAIEKADRPYPGAN